MSYVLQTEFPCKIVQINVLELLLDGYPGVWCKAMGLSACFNYFSATHLLAAISGGGGGFHNFCYIAIKRHVTILLYLKHSFIYVVNFFKFT